MNMKLPADLRARLQRQVATGHFSSADVRAGLDAGEGRGPARIDLDGADRTGLARVLRTVLAPRPRGMDAADEIERGVEGFGQRDGNLAFADAIGVLIHVGSDHVRTSCL